MAISGTKNSETVVATAGDTTFNLTNAVPFFDATTIDATNKKFGDLAVTLETTAGVITQLTPAAEPLSSPAGALQFRVDATNDDPAQGATITIGGSGAETTGDKYTISREVSFTQQYDLQEGATIDPTALNKAFDRVVAQNQQQNDSLSRTLTVPVTDPDGLTYQVGSVTSRAGKVIGFDENGNVAELSLVTAGSVTGNSSAGIQVLNNQISAIIDSNTMQFTSGAIGVKANAISQSELQTDSVNTDEIVNSAVTADKLSSNAVTTAKILDNNVTYGKIQATSGALKALGAITQGNVTEIPIDNDLSSVSSGHNEIATSKSIVDYVDSKGITQTSGTAPYYGVRAFARYQGTGTPTLLDSGNITDVTRNGIGDYTFNLTTAMPDANYVVNVSCSKEQDVHHTLPFIESISTDSFRVRFFQDENSNQPSDKSIVCVTVVG